MNILRLKILSFIWITLGVVGSSWADQRYDLDCLSRDGSEICSIRPYHYPLESKEINEITNISILNENNKLDFKFSKFKEQQDSIAFLFLVDTSDPRRGATIEIVRKLLSDLFKLSDKSTLLGLATFDSKLDIISPVGVERTSLLNSLNKLNASGLTTELYRSVQSAINYFSNINTARKVIVLVSDGKSEDIAYTSSDVVKLANEKNIIIYSIGVLEKKNDPSRQTLMKLTEETGGAYFDYSDDISSDFYKYAMTGGLIEVNLDGLYGEKSIKFNLLLSNNETIMFSRNVELGWGDALRGITVNNKKYLALFFIAVVLLFFLFKRSTRVIVARLRMLDNSQKTFDIQSSLVKLGRNVKCDIQLQNDSVSSFHAAIRNRDGVFTISDINSLNGTMVNGGNVGKAEIFNGDEIQLGEVRLKFSTV